MLPDFGWTELLVIAIVLIVVVGPKDLPRVVRGFSKTLGSMRKMAGDFRKQFDDALSEAELDDLKNLASDVKDMDPRNKIKDALNPLGEVGRDINDELKGVAKSIEASAEVEAPAVKQKAVAKKPAAKKTAAASGSTAKKAAAKKPATKKPATKAPASKSTTAKASSAKTASKAATTAKKPAAKRAATARKPATKRAAAVKKPAASKAGKA